MPTLRRYAAVAPFYDVLSGERFLYRPARVAGVQMLGLRPGDAVIDLGCGTGLNLPLLVDAVGPSGLVIGLDQSPRMLRMARQRVTAEGWGNVHLVEDDAERFDPERIRRLLDGDGRVASVDGVFASYALSVFDEWQPAWYRARSLLRPGGRAAIVDVQLPTGPAAVFAPLALIACSIGRARFSAKPWRVIERDGTDVISRELLGGHVRVVAGTF